MERHRLAEHRSLHLHRAVAERLRRDPGVLERARARVEGWARDGSVHRHYVDAWRDVLSRSLDEICAFLGDPSPRACELRQVSPFAGVLTARERWRIWRAAGEAT